MRRYLLFTLLPFLFISCREVQTATSCSGVNYTRVKKGKTGQEPGKWHLFHHHSKQDRKDRRSTKRAEKGKKGEKDKTKLAKRLAFWKRKKDGAADTRDQNKGVFGQTRKNGKKQRKLIRKRSKHPQNDLWPNGHPG